MELKSILSNGISIKSSGTTGTPKDLFQSPKKLKSANAVAVDCQKITSSSRIYTVCKMEHAGGLLAQTLPAYSVGADIVIEDFNAYRWVKEINKYTHTHLTPNHCRAIMGTKDFWSLDLSNIWITCGSDPVGWDLIKAFVGQGCTFMANWGMTEIGPCAINTTFTPFTKIEDYENYAPEETTIIGNDFYCDWKVENNQLYVKGDTCIYDDWFATGDIVELKNVHHNPILYYKGRL